MKRNFQKTAIALCVSSSMVIQQGRGTTVNKPPTVGQRFGK
jgi:hypothetical protein